MAEIFEDLEKVYIVKLDERGRIYLPKAVRERLQMKFGDKLCVKITDDHIVVYTAHAIRRHLPPV